MFLWRGGFDGGKQGIPIDWFLQVGRSAELVHSIRGAGFIMSRDDYDWHQDVADLEGSQHIETVSPRHVQVEQYAVHFTGVQACEEIFCARIFFDTEATGSEQSAQSFSHFRLVIQHRNN